MSQNDFLNRLGATIIRIAPDGRESLFEIANYKVAEYLCALQKHGFKYKVPVTIHNSDNSCVACQG